MTLGLSLKLSPDAVASLQQSRCNESAVEVSEGHSSDEHGSDFSQDSARDSLQQQDGEDWDDTIQVSSDFLQDVNDTDECVESGAQDDESVESEHSDEISLSPPPTLPLVVVDLERLCGFIPSTKEEAQELKHQVIEALSRDDGDGEDNTTETEQHDRLAQHFLTHVAELFETQMAHHGDTLSTEMNDTDDLSKVVIEYPEFLCRSDTDPPSVMVTARQWKRLLKPHKIAVVDKLLQHLKDCNRPLSWKIDMYEELSLLVKREEIYRQSQQEESQLLYWKTQRRKQRLDQLYQVRESFDHQLETATEKLQVLEQECDEATAKELARLRLGEASSGGLAALDFDTSIFSFGATERGEENPTNQVSNDVNEFDDEMSSSNGCGYESSSQSENAEVETDHATGGRDVALPAIDAKERSKARQKAAIKSQRRRLQSQQESAKELARIEQAYAEEERVRESCTSHALLMAQATVKSLEERLQQVDDLLESLQEEEWADEEEGILQTEPESTASGSLVSCPTPATAKSTELSLLDSVMAMILGSVSRSGDISTADHYKFIQKEHQDIVREWNEYFGRLPSSPLVEGASTVAPATTASTVNDTPVEHLQSNSSDHLEKPLNVEELKETLGIKDNANLDWDSSDDEAKHESPHPLPSKKAAVGLRPGGKAMR